MKNLLLVLQKSAPTERRRFITRTILAGVAFGIILTILVRVGQLILPTFIDVVCSVLRVNFNSSAKELVIKVPTTIHMGNSSTTVYGYSFIETITAWLSIVAFVFASGTLIITSGCVALSVVLWYFTACADSFKLDEAIPTNHGKSLIAVACRTRHASLEYTSTFHPDGSKIGESTLLLSAKTQLTPSALATTRALTNCVSLHNHPHTNSAFSSGDFRAAIYRRVKFYHVVAGNMFYTLELTERCWSLDLDSVSEYYAKIYDDLKSQHQTIDDATHTQIVYDTCRETANQFGITFTAESYYSWLTRQLWLRAKATYTNLHNCLVMVLPLQARS